MGKRATSLTPQTCTKILVHAYRVAQYVTKMMMMVDARRLLSLRYSPAAHYVHSSIQHGNPWAAPTELHQKLVQCTTLTHMIAHPTVTGHIST
jgi:hypothetical protein